MSDDKKNKNREKLLKKLGAGVAEELDAQDSKGLKASIVSAEATIREVRQEMEQDEKLQGAKAIVKDLSGPYRDAVKAQQAKIQYALQLLDDRGEISRD